MNKEQFTVALIIELKKRLGKDYNVLSNITLKTNGLKLTGLIISKSEGASIVSPNIYIDEYFKDYQRGAKSMADIVEAVLICYYTIPFTDDIEQKLSGVYLDYKKHVRCKLINTEKNKELLESSPHREWNNLSIVYYLVIDEDYNNSYMTVGIDNNLQRRLGVSEEELYQLALQNMDASVVSMTNYLLDNDVIGEGDIVEDNLFSMYIARTKASYGAVSILKPNLLSDLAKKLCSNFLYLIPSSIHEMVIIKAKEFVSVNSINDMIQFINQTQVMPDDFLSDICYRYDSTTNRISVA